MPKHRHRLLWIAPLALAAVLAVQTASSAKRSDWTADELSRPFPPAATEAQLIEVLRTGPPAEKAFACKQLAIYGSKAAVPELAKLLSNPQLASWSRIALEAIPNPAADAALVEAAQSLEGQLLVGAINSIGVRRSEAAVDPLARRLNDQDAEVASAAAVALGLIGNEAATKILRQSLTAAAPAVRPAIAEGCILCAERLMTEGKHDRAAEIYDEVRQADVPKQRALEATRGAILARGTEGVPLLIETLKSPDKSKFQIGLSTARELPGRDVAEALAAELERTPSDRAALIVFALGDRENADLPAAVVKAATAGDAQVRLAAIEVIGRLGDASNVPTLLEIATSGDPEITEDAKAALAKLPGEKVDRDVVARLANATGKSKAVLIEVVGMRRVEATDQLVQSLDDKDAGIRKATLAALGATVGPGDLRVLIEAVTQAEGDADRDEAIKALREASIRMPDREATAEQLAAAGDNASADVKASLLKILGDMGGTIALRTLSRAAEEGDETMQDAATRALGAWMTPDAAPVLLKLAASDNKHNVRALRGYLRIARQLNLPPEERMKMATEALKIAKRPEERKLALDVLPRCPSPAAIDLARTLLDDEAVRANAAETIVVIAERIKDENPDAASDAAQQALAAGLADGLKQRAQSLVKSN